MTFPEIEFSKIENDTIFQHDFFPFDTNNRISFSSNGIAVLYGPNGTGKSSLAKVLAGKKGTSVAFIYNGTEYTDASQIFHVISDQNNRNIISGHTKDFLLGDNIILLLIPTPTEWGLFLPIFPHFPQSRLSHQKSTFFERRMSVFTFSLFAKHKTSIPCERN